MLSVAVSDRAGVTEALMAATSQQEVLPLLPLQPTDILPDVHLEM